jgi:hypothetical protein
MKQTQLFIILTLLLISAFAVPVAAAGPFDRVTDLFKEMGGSVYDLTLGPILDKQGTDRDEALDIVFRIILGILLAFVTYYLLAERMDPKIAGVLALAAGLITILAIQPKFFAGIAGLYGSILMAVVTLVPSVLLFIVGTFAESHIEESDWGSWPAFGFRLIYSIMWLVLTTITIQAMDPLINNTARVGMGGDILAFIMLVPVGMGIWFFGKALFSFYQEGGRQDWTENPDELGFFAKRARNGELSKLQAYAEEFEQANSELYALVSALTGTNRIKTDALKGRGGIRLKQKPLEALKHSSAQIAHNLRILRKHIPAGDPQRAALDKLMKDFGGSPTGVNPPVSFKVWTTILFNNWDSARPGQYAVAAPLLLNTRAGQQEEIGDNVNNFHKCASDAVTALDTLISAIAARRT